MIYFRPPRDVCVEVDLDLSLVRGRMKIIIVHTYVPEQAFLGSS